ncbi:glycosyltransferase family 4 protein [Allocoleopsis franciscana]|uniref:Glycosyltransferase n=1 Tax=Allocoleopsis franciscana PCC 7113 TaxID=1173027 RepID=K9WKI5_9CYAN|nr:glycosyltransferase family 1 protein [Allocoleopsis franciscana]AFZ20925.1 glycosyltransferase [Allocoleopsis franciscana PCC 7113]
MTDDQTLVNLSVLFSKPTGISTYAINLLPHLQQLNPTLLISPTVSTWMPLSDYTCYSIPGNLTPEQGTKGHFRRLLWTQLQLPRIYNTLRSRLLFSPIPEAPLYTNCRYVVMVHDLIPLRFPRRFSPLTPYFRYYIPQVLAQAQHIICNSTATARDITDFFHIPSAKITPIPLAYDANHFRCLERLSEVTSPLPPQPPFLTGEYKEKRLSLDSSNEPREGEASRNRPYFLYIGRHDPYKNLHRLIDAFAALPNCHDYELWLVGSTDQRYTPKLGDQADQLGLTHQVKFLDYLPYNQLPTIINQAIALVFPTLWEGFGLPVLEAMACGTPVITSNLSSLPEVAGNAALVINPYNAGEITEAMQAIATDSELRSRLRALSLNRASQFSWAKTGQATVEVLQRYL